VAGAQVLAEEFGPATENTSKRRDKQSLRSGQLVVVDEASPAVTFALDTLREQARNACVKVVLVGDWAQLIPVDAGGAFHMLVHEATWPQGSPTSEGLPTSGKGPLPSTFG